MIHPDHPDYKMVEIPNDDSYYTNVSRSPDDDYRQFGEPCKHNFCQPEVDWTFLNKRYIMPNADFLPDEVVKDYNDDRLERIERLEKLVENMRLQQTIDALPKKERKHRKIVQDPAYTIKQRLRKKLEQKQEEKDNFIS